MPKADLPPNEIERLAALHSCGVLDTAPEDKFDDLTGLAKELCDVPIALISLVDRTRQWFKSCVGLAVCETPRDQAFCAHALLGPGPLIIEDACNDPRTSDNPLVTGEPGIRFYAGVPLVTSDGYTLGTLCVIDTKPRGISARQIKSLIQLARQATAQLELRRALRELTASREKADVEQRRYRLLVESAEVIVWEFDAEADAFTYVSPSAARLGYPVEDWLKPGFWHAHLHPDDRDEAAKFCLEQVKQGAAHRFQYRMIAADGREVWIDDHVSPPVVEGSRQLLRGVLADITERRRSEDELRQANQRLTSTFAALAEGVVVQNKSGEIVTCNAAAERILGLTFDQMSGRRSTDPRWRATREDGTALPGSEHPAMRTLRSGIPIRGSVMGICTPDGERRYISISTEPVRDTKGEVSSVVASFADITRVREQEQRMRLVVDGAGLGTWDWHVPSGTVVFNERWSSMLGYAPGECEPCLATWERLLNPEDRPRVEAILREHLEGRAESYQSEHRLLAKDGSWKWILDVGRVLERDHMGKPVRAVGIHVDVTEAKELELELTRAKAAAEAASRSKSEFLANMSHEIRTPMTAILGYADLLLDDGDLSRAPERRVEAIGTIRRNGEHLLSIINDILDLSKIEAGCMSVESLDASPASLLREVLSLMSVRAESKGIALSWSCATPVPANIRTDPLRLRQILVNLIGNAIKFTEVGWVRVEVSASQDASLMTFAVRDSGVGISPDHLSNLFKAFGQADTSTTRRFGGTGLGLSISKRLSEMLGGDIRVTSTPGAGSCFEVSIATRAGREAPTLDPATFAEHLRIKGPAGGPSLASPLGTNLNGVRVLLAEDGPDNVRLFAFYLRKAGAIVTIAPNGLEAVRTLCERHDHNAPLHAEPPVDVLISDMQMPEMDGYEAVALLRSKGCTLPIVALTAHAMSTDADRCHQAGCDVYGSKPIDAARLVALCREAMTLRARGSGQPQPR
ncbi:MAG: PAS domain S-box protein [Phycisphaerales bacterium]